MKSRRTLFAVLAVAIFSIAGSALAGAPAVTVVSDSIQCRNSVVTQLPSHKLDPGWMLQNTGTIAVYVGTSGIAATAGNNNIPAGQSLNDLPWVNSNLLYCRTAGTGSANLAIFGGRGSP